MKDSRRGGLRCAASCQGLAIVLRWLMVFVIAQALDEGLTLVTVDPTLRAYDITVFKAIDQARARLQKADKDLETIKNELSYKEYQSIGGR